MTFASAFNDPAIEELKAYKQWVAWKSEKRGDNETKVPVNPYTANNASTSNPSTWGDFNQASECARLNNFKGIGFVLTDNDDYTGIDLDKCLDDEGIPAPWVQEILDLAETYCEVSPSGRGLRMFARGKIDKSIKGAGIELYRNGRYLTITGQRWLTMPDRINPAPNTINALLRRIEEAKPKHVLPLSAPLPTYYTPVLLPSGLAGDYFRRVNDLAMKNIDIWVPNVAGNIAKKHSNGAWRIPAALWGRSDLQEDYSIHPDGIKNFGLHDMGDPREGKRTPIDAVMFFKGIENPSRAAEYLCDIIGVRKEDMGWGIYGEPIEVNRLEGMTNGGMISPSLAPAIEAAEPKPCKIEDKIKPLPLEMVSPHGLIGDIARFICATTRSPQPDLALGAALVIVATCAGRYFCGATGSALHLYCLGLAPTGSGKDHPQRMISRILQAAGLGHLIGSSEFTSDAAVATQINEKPLCVSVLDEFGAFLRQVNHPKASSHLKSVSKILRTLWGISFDSYVGKGYAGGEGKTIFAPCLSLFGCSTYQEFYDALTGEDMSNGFLNRFLLFHNPTRPQDQPPTLSKFDVPQEIVERLKAIHNTRHIRINFAPPADGGDITPCKVDWADDQTRLKWEAYRRANEKQIDAGQYGELYARCAEIAIRIATISAIANDEKSPTIGENEVDFGVKITEHSIASLIQGVRDYVADSETQTIANHIKRVLKERGGIATRKEITYSLRHRYKRRDLADVLQSLEETGELIVLSRAMPPQGGTITITYQLGEQG